MKSTEEKIRIMQAFVDKKEVQWSSGGGFWNDLVNNNKEEVCWNWQHNDYRIKPKTPRYVWINEYPKGFGEAHATKELADRGSYSNRIRCIKFVEVID